MIPVHLSIEVLIGIVIAGLTFFGRSALKGIESATSERLVAVETKMAAQFKQIDMLRVDVEMLKANYWSKADQVEFGRDMKERLKGLDEKLDRVLDRMGHQN